MIKPLINKVRCKKCGDIIESKNRHDMVWCKCGAIAIDGGKDYQRFTGSLKYIDDSYSVFEQK
jgi:hypothetical protein|uniref:DUF7695 domain-containing protein n=1 Tax=Aerococcus urinaeequi TaxID=51665 RepID=UPI00352B2C28